MSEFVRWNSLLLSEFFPPSAANEEVWLQTTRAELDSLGLHLGGAEGLVRAVKAGAPWMRVTQHCADAAAELAGQRKAARRPAGYTDPGSVLPEYAGALAPAYLPYLALWVLVSSEADEGFYAHMNALLGMPELTWPYRRLTNMEAAWTDLQRWSNDDASGRFGKFVVRVLGEHRFVGVPRSQCLMSPRDHVNVGRLFHAVGLRPGQHLTDSTFAQVAAEGAHSHFLSSGLRRALAAKIYQEPLQRLLAVRLESWDGRVARLQNGVAGHDTGDAVEDPEYEATVALVPWGEPGLDWLIRWRVPAVVYSGTIKLKAGEATWPGSLEKLGTHASTEPTRQADAVDVLKRTENGAVPVSVTYVDDTEENGGVVRRLELRRKLQRVLAWDSPDPARGIELVEKELPIAGPAYLLLSPTSWGSTKPFLERQGIRHEACDTGGLPPGWKLVCLPECEELDRTQRNWLCDGQDGAPGRARIRLVGGRPIIRGGTRRYAFYDLPVVELEAEPHVELAAEGLSLERVDAPDPRIRTRTYRMSRTDTSRALFELRAIAGAEVVARCTIRVTAPGGTSMAESLEFGIEPLGQASLNGALRGLLRGIEGTSPAIHDREFASARDVELGRAVHQDRGFAAIPDSVAAKFLDTLAQLGSMSYGVARDQIARLSAGTAGSSVSPALMLLELRARAHLELATDNKGHLTRVHSVPPSLYSVPAYHDGLQVVAVCGSLRLEQWRELVAHDGCIPYLDEAAGCSCMPVLLLLCSGEDDAAKIARDVGLGFSKLPAAPVANWAGSLQQAADQLAGFGWASLGNQARGLQRLQPACAVFFPVPDGILGVDARRGRDLFRFDDPDIQGHQVYVLGTVSVGRPTQYSYVHDSRWGVWLAITAFASMARSMLGIEDACPWPIPYCGVLRELWLPARLRPPFVLERALVLCSGGPPASVAAVAVPPSTLLARQGRVVGQVSPVYGDMMEGTWLCYRWVPPQIATRVATLLGGSLQPLETCQ